MITLNAKYLPNCNAVAEKLEARGHTVAVIDETDIHYESDCRRERRQRLSPHDWNSEAESDDLRMFLRQLSATRKQESASVS